MALYVITCPRFSTEGVAYFWQHILHHQPFYAYLPFYCALFYHIFHNWLKREWIEISSSYCVMQIHVPLKSIAFNSSFDTYKSIFILSFIQQWSAIRNGGCCLLFGDALTLSCLKSAYFLHRFELVVRIATWNGKYQFWRICFQVTVFEKRIVCLSCWLYVALTN